MHEWVCQSSGMYSMGLSGNCHQYVPSRAIFYTSDLYCRIGATTGSGQCFYKFAWGTGTYSRDSSWYASAELISPSTSKPVSFSLTQCVGLPANHIQCPYWNQTTFIDTSNTVWQVYCGFDSSPSAQQFPGGYRGAMESCMTQCAGLAGCEGFSYNYGGAEQPNGQSGACFMKSGFRVTGRVARVNAAIR